MTKRQRQAKHDHAVKIRMVFALIVLAVAIVDRLAYGHAAAQTVAEVTLGTILDHVIWRML
jgi:hypothetical protein